MVRQRTRRRRFVGIHLCGWLLGLALQGCASPVDYAALRARAERGDPKDQFAFGAALDQAGKAGAARWYRAAAEQGLAEAQNSLGSLYQAGDDVTQDYAEAASWYRKASDQGHPEATNSLGYLYDLGLGTAEDNPRAAELYALAGERGSINAMLNISVLIMQEPPKGLAGDVVEAYKWASLANLYASASPDRELARRSRELFDHLRSLMTKAQLSEGERRTESWDSTHRAGVRVSYPEQRVSILPPRGFGWISLPRAALSDEQFAGFGKRLRDTPPSSPAEVRSVVAIAALIDGSAFGLPADAQLASAEDLADAIEQGRSRPDGPRRRLVDATSTIDRSRGLECVRYDERIEDVGVPGFPGSVFRERQRGLRCLHPSLSGRVIDLGCSERHLQGVEPLDLCKEADVFLDSLTFIARPTM